MTDIYIQFRCAHYLRLRGGAEQRRNRGEQPPELGMSDIGLAQVRQAERQVQVWLHVAPNRLESRLHVLVQELVPPRS